MGLTEAELQLVELLGQVLELLRWNQVLGYSNQYLLHEKLGLSQEERHRVMKAAAAAVEQDGRLQDWGRRLIEIQDALERIQVRMMSDAPDDAALPPEWPAGAPDASARGSAERGSAERGTAERGTAERGTAERGGGEPDAGAGAEAEAGDE